MILVQAPVFNVQLLLDGLFIGATFALAAYGLALVWGVMNVKNLAQGDFVIMGGYIAWWLGTQGIHPLWGLPVAIVVMFAFGWGIYVTIIRRVIDKDLFTSLLATFGLAIVIAQLLNLMFGPEVQTAESDFAIRQILGAVTVAEIKVLAFLLCGVLALAVVIFMKKSRMGQAIRATAQDARTLRPTDHFPATETHKFRTFRDEFLQVRRWWELSSRIDDHGHIPLTGHSRNLSQRRLRIAVCHIGNRGGLVGNRRCNLPRFRIPYTSAAVAIRYANLDKLDPNRSDRVVVEVPMTARHDNLVL